MKTDKKTRFPVQIQAPLVLLSVEDAAVFQSLFFYILIGAAIILIAGTIYGKMTARTMDPFILKEKPEDLFDLAMNRDERFDIALSHGSTATYWPYSGKCSKIKRKTIVIDTRLAELPKKLVGARVQVNFQLIYGAKQLFLQFESSVASAYNTGKGYALEVRIPRYVVQNQKRQFLRLEMEPALLGPVVAWPLKPITPEPKHARELGAPKLGFNSTLRNLRVIDISATGIGFRIAHYPAVLFKREMPFVFLISLKNMRSKVPLSLWLYAKVRYVYSPSAKDDVKLGASIEKWAYVQRGPTQGQIAWHRTGKEGEVLPLLSWIQEAQNQANLIRVARNDAEREATQALQPEKEHEEKKKHHVSVAV